MKNTVSVELTYAELRVLRRALGSRDSILDDRIERHEKEGDDARWEIARNESRVVNNLYERFSYAIEGMESKGSFATDFATVISEEV